jgi:hypothetical protein
VDLVAKPGPLAQEGCPVRDLATQRERRAVRRPDLREEVGGPERASTSASTLSVFTFADAILGAHRVRDRHPARVLREQLDERPGEGGRLDDNVIRRLELLGERPKLAGRGPDPAHSPRLAALLNGDLGKALVDVKRDRPHVPPFLG